MFTSNDHRKFMHVSCFGVTNICFVMNNLELYKRLSRLETRKFPFKIFLSTPIFNELINEMVKEMVAMDGEILKHIYLVFFRDWSMVCTSLCSW